jgi:hypothetical protein
VATYSFDEENEETQADTSGDGHTANVEGATWTSSGRYGGAMEFEALEKDVLKVPASSDLNFSEEFTLEAWVRPSGATNQDAPLIDKQKGGGLGYFLYEGGSKSDVPFGAADPSQEHVHATEALPADTWSHVALVFDGERTFLYVDGKEVQNGAAAPLTGEKGELEIGGSTDTGDFFDGRIDEVRIYNRNLTAAEVDADMEGPIQTSKQGPAAAWSFNEGEPGVTTVQDITGHGHTATIHGAEWTIHGRRGQAMQFEAEDSDYLSVPESPELDLTEEFTLEAWVRPEDGDNQWSPVVVKEIPGDEGLTEFSYFLYDGDYIENRPAGGAFESEYLHAPESLPKNTWAHIALTYDGSVYRLYVNRELVDQGVGAPPPVSEGDLEIGGSTEQGNFFSGRIDELQIYDRALSPGELG